MGTLCRLWGGSSRASLWLPALLLLLLLTIGFLVGTLALVYQEYTEEIERLRRDLLAAREKNGVYIAQENYLQMTNEIEAQTKEIVEKLERIKAMEEEMARKEEAFQQLQTLYDEQKVVLQATTEELNGTKHNLTMTRSKLKQTRRQRDEKSHIVLHQMHTEQKLGSQAKEILKVADVSTDHVRKLHSKLDRKRSVEKENERISQEFRDTFAQNAVRMEDSLTRFVQDHSKFLGDVSANYGSLLEKQGRDLSALSELMSSLVKSQSQYAEGVHKAAADSTHASHEFVKVFLGTTRTQVNSQTAAHHQFLVESFLPKLQAIAATLQEQGQAVQQLQRTLTTELQQQADLVNVMLTEQKDGMNRLREVAQQWDQQTDSQLRRISEQQAISSQALSEFDAESNKQMQMIFNLVTSVQQTRENFKSRINISSADLSDSVQKAQEERSKFYHVVETTANEFVSKGKDWRGQLESARSTLLQTATVSLEKGTARLQEASKTCSALEGDVASHVTAAQSAWQELYSAQENDLRKHSDRLNTDLRSHAQLTTESLTALHNAAQTQETLLEEQRADLSTLVRERKDDFEAQTTALNDWSLLLGTEIKHRNEDVVKFLSEDLRHDAPTGQTPQRRDFGYPRFLASTSPHDRIIERYRQEHPDSPASEDDDAAEYAELARRPAADQLQQHGGVPSGVHRSVSMNDLTDDSHQTSDGVNADFVNAANPLHKAASVEGSLNTAPGSTSTVAPGKDNKENFAVPQGRGVPSKREMKQPTVSSTGRKILNSQNSKAQ